MGICKVTYRSACCCKTLICDIFCVSPYLNFLHIRIMSLKLPVTLDMCKFHLLLVKSTLVTFELGCLIFDLTCDYIWSRKPNFLILHAFYGARRFNIAYQNNIQTIIIKMFEKPALRKALKFFKEFCDILLCSVMLQCQFSIYSKMTD